jgi:rhodanese-related sulfurtransferase
MPDPVKSIDARSLKSALHDGGEIALLDAREELTFGERHILMASCVPAGRVEIMLDALVPRREARLVWCDDGDGSAERAARRSSALGYRDVSVLSGGVAAWEQAGFHVYSGVHVPSKAFAEVVEHDLATPWTTAPELKSMIDNGDDIVVFDSRSFEEYHTNSIPTAVSVPGAELVYRFSQLVPSPDTTVIVNCGGRTRSIIGAQSLINAGVPNRVMSLKDGTMAWHLAGFEVVAGARRTAPADAPSDLEAARHAADRIADRLAIPRIDRATLDAWRSEAGTRSLYVLDVRLPEDYAAGHVDGIRSAPGGQLVQETDSFLATWGARVVLADTDGIRAVMTASWLKQMGWHDVAVIGLDEVGGTWVSGPYRPVALGLERVSCDTLSPAALKRRLDDGSATVVDLAYSKPYRNGHIPGAWFATRSRLADAVRKLPTEGMIALTSPDGDLARLAAADLAASGLPSVAALDGGTQAWIAAGYPLETGADRIADTMDDLWLPARELSRDRERAMRAYLEWEIDLINRMRVDDDQRFNVVQIR